MYGGNPEMPECDALHIVEYLIDVGVMQGEHSLPYAEIESWQRQCGIELQPWEVRFVKRLSEAYLTEMHAARDPDAEAPWIGALYVVPTLRMVSNRMKATIRGLA